MKKENLFNILVFVALLALTSIVCVSSGSTGEESGSEILTALLSEITGQVQVLKPSVGVLEDAVEGQEVVVGDQVLTHKDGRALLTLSDGTTIRLSPLTTFVLEEMDNKEEGAFTRLKLEVGRIWVILNGGALEVDTPSGLASVRGSYLHVWVVPASDPGGEDEVYITCLEGQCSLGNGQGTVNLIAGQTAKITGSSSQPESGKMSDDDVDDWLSEEPDATLVIVELTATVAAGADDDLPEVIPPTATYTPEEPSAPTATALDCGPPEGWISITVQEGDTLEDIAAAFGVTVADLQNAACLGDSTTLVAGMILYVPNVPTITPTFTNTPTPTKTPVPPTKTSTPVALPSDQNATFANPIGPNGVISTCDQTYKIDVTDPDGITEVKLYYSVGDGSEPTSGSYEVMSLVSGSTYKAVFAVPTFAVPGTDTVYYRYAVYDSLGNVQFYPAPPLSPFSFTDPMDCEAPTNWGGTDGPDGQTLFSMVDCDQYYEVTVTDLNGIAAVEMGYTITDGVTTSSVVYVPLSMVVTDTWGITTSIDMTAFAATPLVVEYFFKAKDGLGNWTTFPTNFTFESTVICGP